MATGRLSSFRRTRTAQLKPASEAEEGFLAPVTTPGALASTGRTDMVGNDVCLDGRHRSIPLPGGYSDPVSDGIANMPGINGDVVTS